ncbi:hypothetical protein [Dyella sp.]|uniref:hypothetical protein n=1 Tax=Dyella sp. TaxID=1869338 RepID=UPI002FDB16CC
MLSTNAIVETNVSLHPWGDVNKNQQMTSPQRQLTLVDRWNYLLGLAGKERKDVSKYPGISSSSITNWLYRDQAFTHRAVNLLQDWASEQGVEGLTYEWINLGEGAPPFKGKARVVAPAVREPTGVSWLSGEGEAPAAVGDSVRFFYLPDFSKENTRFIDIPSILLGDSTAKLMSSGIRVYTNPDDIMRGEVEKGDLVFVDTDVKDTDVDGLYVCKLGRIPMVRRVTNLGDRAVRLTGNQYSVELAEAKLDSLQIGGRVVGRIGRTSF